jgi:hypothetical protein
MARKWWTLLAACSGLLILLTDITIVNVALPSITKDLDASFSDLPWTRRLPHRSLGQLRRGQAGPLRPSGQQYLPGTGRLPYKMPAYQAGHRRLYVGAWKHGISVYGWPQGGDGGFTARHPELLSGRATIRLRSEDAAGISDGELRDLVRAALTGG